MLAIKISLGKYSLEEEFDAFFTSQLARNDFTILPIKVQHAATLSKLPFHHRDPFDRMLVAQAMADRVSFRSDSAWIIPHRVYGQSPPALGAGAPHRSHFIN